MSISTKEDRGVVNEKKLERRIRFNMFFMLTGKTISLLGSVVYGFALSLYVLKATGSGIGFAATLLSSLLPGVILGPFAGVLADRVNRKRMVIWMDILSGVVVLGLYFLIAQHGFKLPYIYLTSILLSVCGTFFNVSMNASIPNLVDDKRLMRMNSLNQTITSGIESIGPVLGGVCYGFMDVKVFLISNALSFFLSAICEAFIDFKLTAKGEILGNGNLTVGKVFGEMGEALNFIKTTRAMWLVTLSAVIINFLTNLAYGVPVPFLINKVLGLPAWQFGCITTAYSLGILIGALSLSFLPEFKNKYRLMTTCLFITAACLFCIGFPGIPGLGLSHTAIFLFYIVVIFVMGANSSFFNVPLFTLLQRTVPDNYRGRVYGLLQTIIMALTPLSYIVAGFIIDKVPAYFLPTVSSVLLAFFIIVSFMRNADIKEI